VTKNSASECLTVDVTGEVRAAPRPGWHRTCQHREATTPPTDLAKFVTTFVTVTTASIIAVATAEASFCAIAAVTITSSTKILKFKQIFYINQI
jgi:hypothetical protein